MLTSDTLHPLAPNKLTGRELADLPRGRFYSVDDLAVLVTEVIPDLEHRIPLVVETDKLPTARRGERPRIRVAVHRDGDGLSDAAEVVSDPLVADTDGDGLPDLYLSGFEQNWLFRNTDATGGDWIESNAEFVNPLDGIRLSS